MSGRNGTPGSMRELGGVLSRTAVLGRFLEQCQFHSAIERELRSVLPDVLSRHTLSCVSRPDKLVVFTGSQMSATQLRFLLAPLLPELRRRFSARWQSVQIRILPTWQPDPRFRPLTKPGPATATQVESAARYSPSDEVHAALIRLAQTLRDSGS